MPVLCKAASLAEWLKFQAKWNPSVPMHSEIHASLHLTLNMIIVSYPTNERLQWLYILYSLLAEAMLDVYGVRCVPGCTPKEPGYPVLLLTLLLSVHHIDRASFVCVFPPERSTMVLTLFLRTLDIQSHAGWFI